MSAAGAPYRIRTDADCLEGSHATTTPMVRIWLRERDSNSRSSPYEGAEEPLLHPALE